VSRADNGGSILSMVSNHYFGVVGKVLLAAIVGIACVKTAIGLITACSEMFSEMFPKSISYKKYAIIFTLFSFIIANFGLNNIIQISIPVLMFLYPLVITLILLTLRYLVVSVGVILFPIGIFCYFFDPLKHYGKLIINFLISNIILTFFFSIIFLASSMLLDVSAFQNIKILVMIGAFTLVNLVTLVIGLFVIVKSALKVASPVMKVVSVVGAVTGA
jgi:hypothetical protein